MTSDLINVFNVSASANENDYYKDGLLYCGVCNEPKEQENIVCDIKIKHAVLCKCGIKAKEEKDEYYKKQEEAINLSYAKAVAFNHSEMEDWNFENDNNQNPSLTKLATNYVNNFNDMKNKGIGLLLYGTTGTGKTYMSACIVNELLKNNYSCIMTNFNRISNTLQGTYEGKQEYIDNLNSYDLLVIDDLGIERNTEYMREIVYSIIDARYRARKPLIITTNLTNKELRSTDDVNKQRIYSRLYEMCMPFEVKGADKREGLLRRNMNKLKEFIGAKENLYE